MSILYINVRFALFAKTSNGTVVLHKIIRTISASLNEQIYSFLFLHFYDIVLYFARYSQVLQEWSEKDRSTREV